MAKKEYENFEKNERTIIRFTKTELIQHWLLLVSLIMLALTGLALFFYNTFFGKILINLEGGIESRGILHRIFAVVLIIVAAWHFLYIVFTERGHRHLMEMLPRKEDFIDSFHLLKYYFNKSASYPSFGLYTPIQKLQYWGAGIGSFLMIVTGMILWMHTPAMAVWPKWVLDVTKIIHGYEGLILFLILFAWHMYIVHFSQGNFPMQKTFLDGKISKERLKHEHRREYEKLFSEYESSSKKENH